MRLLVTSLALCCFAVIGYAQETSVETVETTEVTMSGDEGNGDVAGVNQENDTNTVKKGCGCGK